MEESLRSYGVEGYATGAVRSADDSAASLADLPAALAANDASERDLILISFNQGVLTGDWDGHISPIGAYDQGARQVPVIDVDRERYVPSWSPGEKLLDALLKPAPAAHGPLAGETRGLVWIKPAAAS